MSSPRVSRALLGCLALLASAAQSLAHGEPIRSQQPLSDYADWPSRHMKEEHHIDFFDSATFFHLHDFSGESEWSRTDIQRFYGLFDKSNAGVTEEKKEAGVQKVLDLFDEDHSGSITLDEFVKASARGVTLPDLGFGPGHHGDDEYEYEIHHFEKYHSGDNVKLEDLTHPEDVEHFKHHEELEKQEEEWRKREKNAPNGIIESNIPEKFRRG